MQPEQPAKPKMGRVVIPALRERLHSLVYAFNPNSQPIGKRW